MSEFSRNWEWLINYLAQSNFSPKVHRGMRGFTASGDGWGYVDKQVQVSMTPGDFTEVVRLYGDMTVARGMVERELLEALDKGNAYLVYESYGLEPSHEPPWERNS